MKFHHKAGMITYLLLFLCALLNGALALKSETYSVNLDVRERVRLDFMPSTSIETRKVKLKTVSETGIDESVVHASLTFFDDSCMCFFDYSVTSGKRNEFYAPYSDDIQKYCAYEPSGHAVKLLFWLIDCRFELDVRIESSEGSIDDQNKAKLYMSKTHANSFINFVLLVLTAFSTLGQVFTISLRSRWKQVLFQVSATIISNRQ